jgi:transposase InsO family protein
MLIMNDKNLDSPGAIKSFLAGTSKLEFSVPKDNRYDWIKEKLRRTNYLALSKKEKSVVREYIQLATGYSRSQLTRLIGQYRKTRKIVRKRLSRHKFARQYTTEDILLLAKTDEAHQTLSGAATKKLFERAYNLFAEPGYERLSTISVAHIYNLRKSKTYNRTRRNFEKTKSNSVKIGERRKPQPNGQPGFIRIDTVHQGDQDKQKGVYHINAVDEVTQFEIVASVEKISENFLIPVLESILAEFPFVIKNFHSDCGSEYINHRVVKLLNKLYIKLTKSRARQCNDNALAECKNGAIVRKYLGYTHIPQKWAPLINEFNKKHLNPYLNFHRPCYFAKEIINHKGKTKKLYPYENVMTPYEKLKSIENNEQYLKPGVTFEELEAIATSMTDLQAAESLRKAQSKLFKTIFAKQAP